MAVRLKWDNSWKVVAEDSKVRACKEGEGARVLVSSSKSLDPGSAAGSPPTGRASEPRSLSNRAQALRLHGSWREGPPQCPGHPLQSVAAASASSGRGIVLPPSGDGPADCDGANPRQWAGLRAVGSPQCFPWLPNPHFRRPPN